MTDHVKRQHADWHGSHPNYGMIGLALLLLIALVVSFFPVIMKSSKRGGQITTATSNAKQVFYLLIDFDFNYGSFPNNETADANFDGKGKGEYSNDYFLQLLISGITRSEEIFYAKGGSEPSEKPDGDIGSLNIQDMTTPNTRFLAKGECGFAYYKGLSTSNHPKTPVLMTPMYGDLKFNPDVHKGKAIVLHVDGSVLPYKIINSHHTVDHRGKRLFHGGHDTVWAKEPFNPDNLHYANAPYSYTPGVYGRAHSSFDTTAIVGSCVAGFLTIGLVWVWLRARRKKHERYGM
ncbi:MAG: hypothetical protein ACPG6P_13305 [Akkermansiaceae bacterium]